MNLVSEEFKHELEEENRWRKRFEDSMDEMEPSEENSPNSVGLKC